MVQGVQVGTISRWKGIPYAQPPLGARFGPMTMQPPVIPAELLSRLSMSEDCLTLNIWSPGAGEKLRPVLVWIHGGGWLIGSGRVHDGTPLTTLGDVVAVTRVLRSGCPRLEP